MATDGDQGPRERPNPDTLFPLDPAVAVDPFANKPVNVVLTFEGGGAKGIVHLGAYRELEEAMAEKRKSKYRHWPRYKLRGVFGTSIGALVAALVAVGYTSEEMLPKPPPPPPTPVPPVRSEGSPWWRIVNRIGWRISRLRHRWDLVRYNIKLLRRGTQSVVLANAGLDKVTSVFGKWAFKFFLLKWMVTRPFWMCTALTIIWVVSLLAVYLGLVNIYPIMHGLWQAWDLSRYDALVSVTSALFELISQFRYEPIISMIVFAFMTVIFLGLGLRWFLRGLFDTKAFTDAIDLALARRLLKTFDELASPPSLDEATRKKIFDRIEEINRAIARKERKEDYRKVVTFQMLREAKCHPLAMAATNVRRRVGSEVRSGAVDLFSTDATPNTIVADAIAASAAVPILFRPVRLDDRDGLYWDGGFTSNLPAWPFDAQREINPDLYTLTIEIAGRAPSRPSTEWRIFRPFRDVLALMIASVFGARELETRRTRRAAVELNTAVGLLDFNMGPKRAHDQIEDSRLGLRVSLNIRCSLRKLYANKCFRICQAIREHLMGEPPFGTVPRIRVSLLQPTRYGARALKTLWRFCSRGSFRNDTDDRLLFRKETSVPGLAWHDFKDVLRDVKRCPEKVIWLDPKQPNYDVGPRHRYSHRLLWNQMEWMLAVPVARHPKAGRGSTDWVVTVDSNIPLELFEFADGKGKAYQDIVDAIRKIATELWVLEDDAKKAASELDEEEGLAA